MFTIILIALAVIFAVALVVAINNDSKTRYIRITDSTTGETVTVAVVQK